MDRSVRHSLWHRGHPGSFRMTKEKRKKGGNTMWRNNGQKLPRLMRYKTIDIQEIQ